MLARSSPRVARGSAPAAAKRCVRVNSFKPVTSQGLVAAVAAGSLLLVSWFHCIWAADITSMGFLWPVVVAYLFLLCITCVESSLEAYVPQTGTPSQQQPAATDCSSSTSGSDASQFQRPN